MILAICGKKTRNKLKRRRDENESIAMKSDSRHSPRTKTELSDLHWIHRFPGSFFRIPECLYGLSSLGHEDIRVRRRDVGEGEKREMRARAKRER
mgnify:CR=1 FL=1